MLKLFAKHASIGVLKIKKPSNGLLDYLNKYGITIATENVTGLL